MGISDISLPSLTLTDTIKRGFAKYTHTYTHTQSLSPIAKVGNKEHACIARFVLYAINPPSLSAAEKGGIGNLRLEYKFMRVVWGGLSKKVQVKERCAFIKI